jgi:hypothetical protein
VSGERSSWLMASSSALGLQHVLQFGRHGVDLRGQVAQFVAPSHRIGVAKSPAAEALRAGAGCRPAAAAGGAR